MGIGGHHFLAAATILHRFYDSPTVGLVETSVQGYSSTTYIATFANGNSVVLQFRPSDRAIDVEFFKIARKQIGDFAPSTRLLTNHEDSLLVYELSRIPGISFGRLCNVPNFVQLLPTVAEGLGILLGKCCMENSSCRTDKKWVTSVIEDLKKSAQNPLLVSFKDDFTAMLERVQSGALDDLPLSISNGDMNPTNLMVTEQGVVSGLVDWEMMDIWPLGFDLGAIHWIMGSGFGEKYSLYENADEIEKRFWVAFMSSVPRYVADNLVGLQFAMKVGTVINLVDLNMPRLRADLDYTIPWSEAGFSR